MELLACCILGNVSNSPLRRWSLPSQTNSLTDSPLYNLKFSDHLFIPNSYTSLGRRRFQHCRTNWEFGWVGDYIDYRGQCDGCGEELRGEYVDVTGTLWEGYRASFWTCFGACVASSLICAGGMRGLGKVGMKVE